MVYSSILEKYKHHSQTNCQKKTRKIKHGIDRSIQDISKFGLNQTHYSVFAKRFDIICGSETMTVQYFEDLLLESLSYTKTVVLSSLKINSVPADTKTS